MQKQKILFLITKATWGGAQRYVYDLATQLPRGKFESVVAFGERGRLAGMLENSNVATRYISALGRDVALVSDIASFFQILVCLWRVNPDVLHLNSSKAAALGALAGRIVGIRKIIFTVHGWPFKENRNEFARIAIYFISWFTALLSHATIVVSKRDEEIGKKMVLVGKKVHYVPLGIEPPAFRSREEAWKHIQTHVGHGVSHMGEKVPRIVTIAELTENKGIRYAIDAVAELKKRGATVEYFVMGDGELRAQLEQQVRDLNIADRVHFLGFIENAPQYLKAFDVFLLPSIKEGMPYVLLEAASAGLLIVVTDAVDEIIPNARLVPSRNAIALADGLEKDGEFQQVEHYNANLDQMIKDVSLLY